MGETEYVVIFFSFFFQFGHRRGNSFAKNEEAESGGSSSDWGMRTPASYSVVAVGRGCPSNDFNLILVVGLVQNPKSQWP